MRHLKTPDPDRDTSCWSYRLNIMGQLRRCTNAVLNFTIFKVYAPFMHRCLHWRYPAIAVTVAAVVSVAAVQRAGIIKFIFFPEADSEFLQCTFETPNGVPIAETEKIARALITSWEATEAELADRTNGKPIKVAVYSVVGGNLGLQTGVPGRGDSLGEVFIEMQPSEERNIHYKEILDVWRRNTPDQPGALEMKFGGFVGGPPGGNIQIDLMGSDEQRLAAALKDLMEQLKTYDGVYDVRSDYRPGKRELRLTLKESAEPLGVTLQSIGSQVRAGFYGQEIARIQRGQDEVKIKVRYTEAERRTLGQLGHMRIRTPNGAQIPLHHVAHVSMGPGESTIRREDGQRKIQVNADTAETANSEEIMTDVIDRYLPVLQQKYDIRANRGFDSNDRVMTRQAVMRGGIIAMLVIYLLMATIFKSYVQPAIIMFTIPVGIAGAVLGHMVYNIPLSMMSFFGMIALLGVAVNDAIVFIVAVNNRLQAKMTLFDALVDGGCRRFRAIVLTSLTTFAGLFPMILERSFQAQILIPMAISIAFGVAVATVGTLVTIPCLMAVLNDLRCIWHYLWHLEWPENREAVEPSANIGKL
jgi:multidrug efflux pump subunit AcrB